MTEALASHRLAAGAPANALARYQHEFPQWSIRAVAKGIGYTAHGSGHRDWGPDLLSLALKMAEAAGTLDAGPAPAVFPGRPGYVVAACDHPMLAGEWRIGFRICDRCPPLPAG